MKKEFFKDDDAAKIVNNFFSNVVKLLDIAQNDCKVFVKEIRDPTLKNISKYNYHPSILAIREKYLSNYQ